MSAILVSLEQLFETRGSIEILDDLDSRLFNTKRLFLISNVPTSENRGNHAHKNCEQFILLINGHCLIEINDGLKIEIFDLNSSEYGLLIPKMHWVEMSKFSIDCKVLVLASEPYEESDYIRNIDNFFYELNEITNKDKFLEKD